MLDFTKIELNNTNPDIIEANPYLEFHEIVNKSTGELNPYNYATYKGLKFKLYNITNKTPYKRITIEGSLHKYWNDGKHNFNDFGINELKEVLKELKIKFKIEPKDCKLRQLEIGVNIKPPLKTKNILNRCLLHKTKKLKNIYTYDEGEYIQARHQRYITKIYDKRKHYASKGYNIENEIMRFELKYQKMRDLNNKGIYTLQDLLNFDLTNFTPILIKEWENVLFFDFTIPKEDKNYSNYSNQTYWAELTNTYSNFKYHRNKLNRIINSNHYSIKNEIRTLISEKCLSLNKNYPY